MNQKQIIMRDFLENVLLDGLGYERFSFLQERISNLAFQNSDYCADEFCSEFPELGDCFVLLMEDIDFPFLKWWNEYCKDFEQECEQNSREEFERLDDYYRIIGAK